MGSPISIGDAIAMVRTAIELYQTVHDGPEQIRKIGKQMEGLKSYLLDVKTIMESDDGQYLANLQSQQRFKTVVRDIHQDAQEVNDILKIWRDTDPYLRWMFSVGKNPGKLENLMGSIDRNKVELGQILQLKQSLAPAPVATPKAPVAKALRSDYGVTFIDPHNLARSKVAEGYTKLLREWTVRTGGMWRIKFAHSAGMGVRNRSDCVETLQSIISVYEGNKPPSETAMASLFDNKFFNYPYKAGIKDQLLKSRSRGITHTIFKTYDFIFVFVDREYNNLLSFKKLLIKAYGKDIAPQGKGRVVHLGAHLSSSERALEITDPPRNNDGSDNRDNWNATTKQIKLALKNFLSKELGWVQPKPTT